MSDSHESRPQVCGVCERDGTQAKIRRLLPGWVNFGLPQLICSDCFSWWYDGEVNPAKIKTHVLAGETIYKRSEEKP